MKKFLIAGSCLGAVAAAGSAGAVDVTLGGSINMGMEFGIGKDANGGGLAFDPSSSSAVVTLSISAAGTTDAGLKYGGSFAIGTATELAFADYTDDGDANVKNFAKFEATDQTANILGVGYMTSGGNQITEDRIVSVRINSEWVNAIDGVAAYGLPGGAAEAANICKLAGLNSATGAYVTRLAADGSVGDALSVVPAVNPVGRLAARAGTAMVMLSAGTPNGNFAVTAFASDLAQNDVVIAGEAPDADIFDVFVSDGGDGVMGAAGSAADVTVTNAAVFLGPEINVMLTSSTTKAMVGAACITVDSASNTQMYMDVTTNVMSVSGAEIFIQGGFGKLTLSAADYAGEVAAVAGAGDQAEIGTTGLTAVLSSGSMMGASVYAGVDLGSVTGSALPNFLVGTSVDLNGISVGLEVEGEVGTGQNIDNWDLGMSYALGDVALGAAYDSANDWGLSMGAAVAGLDLSLAASYANAAHTKSGLSIDGTVSTSLNGIGITVGFDESMNYSIGMSYAMDLGIALSAGYSSEDEGGSLGASLSF